MDHGNPRCRTGGIQRKRLIEIQYLRTTITDDQRKEFSDIVHETIQWIESAQFLPHSGIRFPQNPCSTCPYPPMPPRLNQKASPVRAHEDR